ncbi:hypothetical protein C8Q75DRAFT_792478 [Abortiporus biennis]|nr:hypothetical protein C8Q75DRAFT_792478 [Abortiporus biennis]
MPAKYSHTKKRPSGPPKKQSGHGHSHTSQTKDHRNPNIHVDRNISQAMSAVSQLERAIARILLIRFEQDIARLFSTHLYSVSLIHLPTFIMRCVAIGGPSWIISNYDADEIKDFFRSVIGMDLRQAGERVATKSVLWSYTALRHFAMSNNVAICGKRGLHSLRLLPHYAALKAHLDTLQSVPPPAFAKPPHLGPLSEGLRALEEACESKYSKTDWDSEWREQLRLGYERLTQTLWRVAREFDVRGYGLVLREKLTSKWCDCGCSTDHLSEVCEKTVREDEEESGVRSGKEREWDGRGSGVLGWETEEEEDIWEIDLDFVSLEPEEYQENAADSDMTIGEMMEWRYFKAEREKEQGNSAFKKGDYEVAIERYKAAHQIEPEMPHYNLNLAAAYLKLSKWMEAEKACETALGQHRSVKGHWRRAQARKAQGRINEAVKDLRAVMKLQPSNTEAATELANLLASLGETPALAKAPKKTHPPPSASFPSSSSSHTATASSSSSSSSQIPLQRPHYPNHGDSSSKQKHPSSPWPRTPSDDRKLKISWMPVTVDTSSGLRRRVKKENNGQTISLSFSFPKNGESFTYPGWDRYTIRRA